MPTEQPDPQAARAPTASPPEQSAGASQPGAPVVSLDRVTHSFGPVEALRDLTFSVPEGRITVLLGPNGAGKTTAIRAITGAIAPDVGEVRTFGLDPDEDGHLVRPHCGVVSAKPALYDRLTGRENLEYAAALYGVATPARHGSRKCDGSAGPAAIPAHRSVLGDSQVGAKDRDRRIEEAAERFGIADALESLVGGYSTGMKTRLALARSVLHDPSLLLFDEPTSGLDPESSYAVLELIREMTSDGRTVVMCTHLLAEAEGLADHVVVIEAGTDLVAGSPEELTRRYWPHPIVTIDAEDPRLLDRISAWPGVAGYRRDPSGARIELDDLRRLPDIVASLVADGVRLLRVDPHEPTLEDLYFTIRRQSGAGLIAPHQNATTLPVGGPTETVSRPGLPTVAAPASTPATGTRGPVLAQTAGAEQGGNR